MLVPEIVEAPIHQKKSPGEKKKIKDSNHKPSRQQPYVYNEKKLL